MTVLERLDAAIEHIKSFPSFKIREINLDELSAKALKDEILAMKEVDYDTSKYGNITSLYGIPVITCVGSAAHAPVEFIITETGGEKK